MGTLRWRAMLAFILWGLGAALLLSFWPGLPFPALAASPERFTLEEPRLEVRAGTLFLHLPLGVLNEMALSDMLRDGAMLELRIEMEVLRKRSLLPNAGEEEKEFSSIIKHDPLTREFRASLPGSGEILHDPLLSALLRKSWKKLELPLLESPRLRADSEYLVEISLSLRHAELPPWLERTLVFWTRDVLPALQLTLDYKVEHAPLPR
jgi:hypothetical protein